MGWYVVPGARVDSVELLASRPSNFGAAPSALKRLWQDQTSIVRSGFARSANCPRSLLGAVLAPAACRSGPSRCYKKRASVAATTVAAFTARLVSGTHYELSGKAPRGGRLRR